MRKIKFLTKLISAPCQAEISIKVFGKGFGGEPFLRKVSPDNYI